MKGYIVEQNFFISNNDLIDLTILLDENSEIFRLLEIPECPDNLKLLFSSMGISLIFDDKGNIDNIFSKKGIDIEKFNILFPILKKVLRNDFFIRFIYEDLTQVSFDIKREGV